MKQLNWTKQVLVGTSVLLSQLFVNAHASQWQDWLNSQVQQHPDIVAAREQLSGSHASADSLEQALYNPELSVELERNGDDDNYQLGIEQTVDWWNRRKARRQQAGFQRASAEAMYQQQLLDKTAEALTALVEWESANRAAAIVQAQQQQLNTLLSLVEQRQRAGDLGSIDAELAFLSLSQQLVQVANGEANLQKGQTRLYELLADWSPERGGVPERFWSSHSDPVTDQELLQHPSVASAHAYWQSLKEEASAVRRAAKAEPTVGVSAGRDGDENVVGLTLSIPLNIRNNFSAETRVAEQAVLEAEAHFLSLYRKQRFDWQAGYAAWQRYEQQYRRWQSVVQGRVENSAELLERQWRSGDLSTTNYLLALNQRAESLLSGIELEKQTQLALVEALQFSGHLIAPRPSTTSVNK